MVGYVEPDQKGIHGVFYLNDWRVEPDQYRLIRGKQVVKLEPKVMECLIYLASKPGETVTREELESQVWSGAVVGYYSLTGTMQKLRKALDDDPKNPKVIETLSKKGYRLKASVTFEAQDSIETKKEIPDMSHRVEQKNNARRYKMLTLLGLSAVLLILLLNQFQSGKSLDSKLDDNKEARSIAVLPFENHSVDLTNDYFINGMSNDLITDLSKITDLVVISRESTSNYTGKNIDLKSVAEKLNARYILHGNMRREFDEIRINAYLVDTSTNTQLWAERYDGNTKNVFALQDKITAKIVSALKIKISAEESTNISFEDTKNVEAYDLFLRAKESAYKHSKSGIMNARDLLEKIITIDPNFARAYADLAWTYVFSVMNAWEANQEQALDKAIKLSDKALSLRKNLPVAYFTKGLAYRTKKQYSKALLEAQQAIAIDPSYANAHVLVATLLYYTGKPKQGLDRMRYAIRLNPHHPHNYPYHLGQAHFVLKEYQKAIDAFLHGLESRPRSERLHLWLAAAYAQIGRIDDAKWEVERVLLLNPEFSYDKIHDIFPFKNPDELQHFLDSLKLAGLSK